MTVFNRRLSEYFEFCKPLLILIVIVGIARLALSLAGVPNAAVRWISVSVVGWIAIVYCAVRVHTSGFGSYKHLLPIVVLLNFAAQGIAIVAIAIAIFTGTDNIYSAPEYSFGGDGKTWAHLLAHLFIGTTVGSLVMWLAGCLLMLVSRKFTSGVRSESREPTR